MVKSLDVDRMLTNSCCAMGVGVMKETIENERSMGCSARVQLVEMTVIGYYRSTLEYADLHGYKEFDGRFQKEVESVSVEQF